MMGIEFRILGPVEVLVDGHACDLRGRYQPSILAMLLLEPNRVVSTSRLIEGIWADVGEERGRLQTHVWGLREALGPRLATGSSTRGRAMPSRYSRASSIWTASSSSGCEASRRFAPAITARRGSS